MTSTELTAALFTAISLLGILCLFWLYRDYAIDRFRQKMFDLRDEVFDFAASGRVSFDHPAYGRLRLTLNGFTRWADELHLLHLLVFVFLSRGERFDRHDSFDVQWNKALGGLDTLTQNSLNAYRDRMHNILIAYIFLGSPLLFATLIVPVTVWMAGVSVIEAVVGFIREPLDRVDAVAHGYGERPLTGEGWSHVTTSVPA